MAIVIENCDEETELLRGDGEDGDLIIPLTFKYDCKSGDSDKIQMEVYPILKDTVEEFLKMFEAGEPMALFSESALSWICEKAGGILSKLGFSLLCESEDYTVCRRLFRSEAPTRAEKIESMNGIENFTEYDIDTIIKYGALCFGVVEDGRLLSAACTNATVDADTRVMEIGVETAECGRGRGLGRDSVIALTNALCDIGCEVYYEYAAKNKPSEALVSGIDSELVSMEYYLVAVREK